MRPGPPPSGDWQTASPRALAACGGLSELSRGCGSFSGPWALGFAAEGFAHFRYLGPPPPPVASVRSQTGPSGVEGQWARPGSLTSRRQVAACLEPRTRGARGGGEAGPGPWGLLATRARAFPQVPMPSPPPGGDSRSARLFCRLAGGTQGSKARPDWALPGTDARSVLNGLQPWKGHLN